MSFFEMLETILIGPLKLLFEMVFQISYRFLNHPGLAIIALSLVINILVLPLYKRADAMQEESRDTENRLRKGVTHIKKTFSRDERMMILQTYYRQNHYSPANALKGSVSLLLEIPFFIAAYQFLSHLTILDGVSLGPIANLGATDGLIVIGSLTINLLPILMTLINIISSVLFLKGYPLKTKIQLYGMALFFLVFLYNSPACLVFYWSLNNLFSLVKTIFYKIKNPKKVLNFLMLAAGSILMIFDLFFYSGSIKRKVFLAIIGILLASPQIWSMAEPKLRRSVSEKAPDPNRKHFLIGCAFLTVLIGLLIPSTFISASPQEFIDISYFYNPLWYLASSLCLAGGTFLVWMSVFYWLANPKWKVLFGKLIWILCGVMLVNYMFFGKNLGVISANLTYNNDFYFARAEELVNLLIIALVTAALLICIHKWPKGTSVVILTSFIALSGMSVKNIFVIQTSVEQVSIPDEQKDKDYFQLSKTGKNVVVIMLDRAMGQYVPYLFQENHKLKEQFAGFTYYSNTISYGGYTNTGSPPLLGGYEYTPVEMNKRDNELLKDKHNEALKVMPVLFSENGYDVTVCDPVYANYQWIPDLSVFDDRPEINKYITNGKFNDKEAAKRTVLGRHKTFFSFSIMKSLPLTIQPTIYNNGEYNQVKQPGVITLSSQTQQDRAAADGVSNTFMNAYNVLLNLPDLTDITKKDTNTFMFMSNDATHEPILLQTPDYTVSEHVDNAKYESENAGRFTIDGVTLDMSSYKQMSHYHANMAALSQVGVWLDFLRKNDVYDNTRIILVSDHGRNLMHDKNLIVGKDSANSTTMELFYPLLMVKDFNSHEFTTSHEFMTNADVPTLAVQDLISGARNPFTNKPINNLEKNAHEQFILYSHKSDIHENNKNVFLPDRWIGVTDSVSNPRNWNYIDREVVLKEHKAP